MKISPYALAALYLPSCFPSALAAGGNDPLRPGGVVNPYAKSSNGRSNSRAASSTGAAGAAGAAAFMFQRQRQGRQNSNNNDNNNNGDRIGELTYVDEGTEKG